MVVVSVSCRTDFGCDDIELPDENNAVELIE